MEFKEPFVLEQYRNKLARKKNYSILVKMYKARYPEISDINTPGLWDKLNDREPVTLKSHPMAYDRAKIIINMIQGKNLKVLNVGFGSGDLENVYLNQDKDTEWHGIDISPRSVRNAKKRFRKGNFKVGNIEKLSFEKNYFDYVVVSEVLEHIQPSSLLKVLKGIRLKLKMGGRLIVSVPLNEGLEEMIARGENPNGHLRVYTPNIIKAELEITGYKIIDSKLLYAYPNNYRLKKTLTNLFFKSIKKPNNIIVIAQNI